MNHPTSPLVRDWRARELARRWDTVCMVVSLLAWGGILGWLLRGWAP